MVVTLRAGRLFRDYFFVDGNLALGAIMNSVFTGGTDSLEFVRIFTETTTGRKGENSRFELKSGKDLEISFLGQLIERIKIFGVFVKGV